MAAQLSVTKGPLAAVVNVPRDQFLPGARFALNKYGAMRRRNQVDLSQERLELGAFSNHFPLGNVLHGNLPHISLVFPKETVCAIPVDRPRMLR